MPNPASIDQTPPEYTGPGLENNLPTAPAPSVPQDLPPLPPGVTRPVMTPPWTLGKRLGVCAVLLLSTIVMGWLCVWLPLADAAHGKTPTYSIKGVLLTSALAYFALLALVVDIRDHTLRYISQDGKPKLKPRAWFIFGGMLIVLGVAVFAFNYALGLYGYTMF